MPAHELLPAVNRLLKQVEETSGLSVAVAQKSDLSTLATLWPATKENHADLIAYHDAVENWLMWLQDCGEKRSKATVAVSR